jgi:hypothetical protein
MSTALWLLQYEIIREFLELGWDVLLRYSGAAACATTLRLCSRPLVHHLPGSQCLSERFNIKGAL